MIAAGDNLFGFSLLDLVSFYKAHEGNEISIYKEDDLKQLIRGGTADIDENGKIIGFEEKPSQVNYPYAVPTFLYHPKRGFTTFRYLSKRRPQYGCQWELYPILVGSQYSIWLRI